MIYLHRMVKSSKQSLSQTECLEDQRDLVSSHLQMMLMLKKLSQKCMIRKSKAAKLWLMSHVHVKKDQTKTPNTLNTILTYTKSTTKG